MVEVKIATTGMLATSTWKDETAGGNETLAPGMLNDDEIFQLFLIH